MINININMWHDAQSMNKAAFTERYDSAPIEWLERVHNVANMDFREMIQCAGLKQADVTRLYGIPRRTVGDWATGKNRCADYVLYLLAKDLKMV